MRIHVLFPRAAESPDRSWLRGRRERVAAQDQARTHSARQCRQAATISVSQACYGGFPVGRIAGLFIVWGL